MKVIVVLCSVLFFTSCIEADENVLPSSTEDTEDKLRLTPSICLAPTGRKLYVKVMQVGYDCVKLGVTEEITTLFRNSTTLEEFRDFFKKFCQKQSAIRNCLAETTAYMVENCHNETLLNTFKIYFDTIETILDIGCNEDGQRLATLWYELTDFIRTNQNISHAKKCGDRYEQMLEEIESSQIDMSSKLYNLHKEIVVFVECFYQLELTQSLKDDLKSYMDVVLNRMKCIHPQDGTLVPCVTIDVSLISTKTVCDVKTFGTEMSLYDLLEEDFETCWSGILHSSFVAVEEGDNDEIRQQVAVECKLRDALPYCYNKSRIVSEICLNATQQKEFELLGDVLKSAYKNACLEDGRRLADVMFEVYRLKRTGQGHAVWGCLDVATSTRNVTDEHVSTSKNMRFYHEMEAFKGCLVDKLRGDQTSVDAATSLIDEVLKKVTCVGAEEGSTVTCESLMHS